MPRSINLAVQNNFIKGLITEATGLTFPDGACTDTENCVFDRTGLVTRRYGFNFEQDFVNNPVTSLTNNAISTFAWTDAAGDGDLTFAVVQIGSELSFYAVTTSATLSANKESFTVDLSTFLPAGGDASFNRFECQFATGNGVLFVTHPNLESFFVKYDVGSNTFTVNEINLQIRDFDGDTTDALAVDTRPATDFTGLTAAHHYNLLNQSFTDAYLQAWDTAQTFMPANNDVSWYYKDATTDDVSFADVTQFVLGNTPAPKGHYLYSVYNVNRSSIVTGAVSYIVQNRVSACSFFAGRVWYAGLNVQNQNGNIYFSQIVQSDDTYGKCYQVNDPTSEKFFDLLASDGGVIKIIEAGTIYKLVPYQTSLLVFASNGVWAISGSQNGGLGFTANDYSITKLSSQFATSASSYIDMEGTPMWWNFDGIFTITAQGGTPAVQSLTYSTIDSFFAEIPADSKRNARGVYDFEAKIVRWLYKSTTSMGTEDKYNYDRVLNFDHVTGAFYVWTLPESVVNIKSILRVIAVSGSSDEEDVTDGAVQVQVSGTDVITGLGEIPVTGYVVKYLTLYNDGTGIKATFSENNSNNSTYTDWNSYTPAETPYNSYFVTGFTVHGQAAKKFQSNYLFMYSVGDSESSYILRSRWDFSTSGDTGRWSTSQLVDNPAGDYAYTQRKLKIRGQGLAMQFMVSNNGTLPFGLIGWATYETANQTI